MQRAEYSKFRKEGRDDTVWDPETVNFGIMWYSVYTVLMVTSWSGREEIVMDNLTMCP